MEGQDKSLTAVCLVESDRNPGGVQLVNTKRTTRADHMDLIELAKQVQKAGEFTRANAVSKLSIIAEQIKFLQQQAKSVLLEAKENDQLHHVACNFKKEPGNIYYLYKRPSGQKYFSLLSPEEWGPSCPHEYLGAYRLEHDMSWTPERKLKERSNELQTMNAILDYQLALPNSSASQSNIIQEMAKSQESDTDRTSVLSQP